MESSCRNQKHRVSRLWLFLMSSVADGALRGTGNGLRRTGVQQQEDVRRLIVMQDIERWRILSGVDALINKSYVRLSSQPDPSTGPPSPRASCSTDRPKGVRVRGGEDLYFALLGRAV